jgi:hypothetical protein
LRRQPPDLPSRRAAQALTAAFWLLLAALPPAGAAPAVSCASPSPGLKRCEVSARPGGVIRVSNPSSRDVTVELSLNGERFHESTARAAAPVAAAGEDAPRAIWRFVAESLPHRVPIVNAPWAWRAPLLLNSSGFGVCGDAASVFYQLARAAGFKARVVLLREHVVAEVEQGGEWAMYDPDRGVFFTDASGRVLSVRDLAGDPGPIFEPSRRTTVPRWPFDAKRYAQAFERADESSNVFMLVDQDTRTVVFTIPAGGRLELGRDHGPPEDVDGKPVERRFYAQIGVTAPKGWRGRMRTFLLAQDVLGRGRIGLDLTLNGQRSFELPQPRFFAKLLKTTPWFLWDIEVQEARSALTFVYLVDPRRFRPRERNLLVLSGEGAESLAVSGR